MRQRKIRVRKYTDSKRPHLQYVVNYREAGKRKRTFFEKKEAADSFANFKNAELKRNGIEGAEFPTSLRVMAQNAVEQLKPFEKTITDAVGHYVAYLKASEKSCTAEQLVKELVAAKKKQREEAVERGKRIKGTSKRHLDDLRQRLTIFANAFKGNIVATITSAEIDKWLRSVSESPVTRNHYRRLLILLFNFAMELGYAGSNPAKKKKEDEPDADIGILTVTEAARLLESASPDVLPYIAIGLFAGLRRAEIERLDWSKIDFEDGLIEVTAETAKTAQRFVTMQPNLREWLLPLRKHRGNVTSVETFRQGFDQARDAAGITVWPSNALRHSFGSYHLAHFKNMNELALEMGNSPGMISKHYRRLVKPKDAERYWNIKPTRAGSRIVPMPRRSNAAVC